MQEFLKLSCVTVLLFAVPGSVVVCTDNRPDPTTAVLQYALPAVSVAAFVALLWLQFRRDRVPDQLRQLTGGFFNRDGFCFAVAPIAVDGVCYIEAYFQGQRDAPCIGQIALRPSKGFFLTRADIDIIGVTIPCEPAAFGICRFAVPLPIELQGTTQSFDVGASVEYPSGKGRRLRFHDGLSLRTNTEFKDPTGKAIAIAGAFTGQIVLYSPATVKMTLPTGVADHLDEPSVVEIRTLWRLGDPHPTGQVADLAGAADSR